jgi:hypothetical protein
MLKEHPQVGELEEQEDVLVVVFLLVLLSSRLPDAFPYKGMKLSVMYLII